MTNSKNIGSYNKYYNYNVGNDNNFTTPKKYNYKNSTPST